MKSILNYATLVFLASTLTFTSCKKETTVEKTVKETVTIYQNSKYTFSGSLNSGSANPGRLFPVSVGPIVNFTKDELGTKIQVSYDGRALGGALSGSATGVRFVLRVDSTVSPVFVPGSVNSTNTTLHISSASWFDSLPVGNHTAQMYVQTLGGTGAKSSSGVLLDPGGWGAKIIIKEFW